MSATRAPCWNCSGTRTIVVAIKNEAVASAVAGKCHEVRRRSAISASAGTSATPIVRVSTDRAMSMPTMQPRNAAARGGAFVSPHRSSASSAAAVHSMKAWSDSTIEANA